MLMKECLLKVWMIIKQLILSDSSVIETALDKDKQKRKDQAATDAGERSQPRRLAAVRARRQIQQQLNDDMTGQD